jgi:hypothetical protein
LSSTPHLDALVSADESTDHPFVASVAYVAQWPSIHDAAFHGLPGEFVRLVGPHSEADPAALLAQFLVATGNLIGRGPHFRVEADRHGLNLYAVVVGDTSKARKGTSWVPVHRLMGLVEPNWLPRVKSGISSGEGIVFEVHDPVHKLDAEGQEVLVDEGVADKRLLLVEPEFASVLKVASRRASTVTTTLRDGWDGRDLSPITKNNRLRATAPHISLVGHVTTQELLRHLTETEAANGFGNRFLWVCARRSKLLPRGGRLHKENLQPLVERIREAVQFARSVGEIARTEETWADWERIYGPLSEGKPGLLGAMIGRAEAQVTRLSALYAVLDQSEVIRPEHQAAAVAVWDFCEASARYIFGEKLGDPTADEILAALRRTLNGLTRTQIRDLFARHKGKAQVARALDVLVQQNLAFCRTVPDTGGRPAEHWYATRDKSDKSDKRCE